MGGIDWAGLPLAVVAVGVSDVEALIDDLAVIKTHHKPDDEESS